MLIIHDEVADIKIKLFDPMETVSHYEDLIRMLENKNEVDYNRIKHYKEQINRLKNRKL
mgnify:CR=1 FL=1